MWLRSNERSLAGAIREKEMKAFITAVVVAGLLALAAEAALNRFVQETSKDAYARPSARV